MHTSLYFIAVHEYIAFDHAVVQLPLFGGLLAEGALELRVAGKHQRAPALRQTPPHLAELPVQLLRLLLFHQALAVGRVGHQLAVGAVPVEGAHIRHLEAHLFARDGAVYPGDASALTLHAAANPYAEAAFAAQTLQSWHERGIPWQYMAVALADAQSMAGILAVTLQSAGIPCYQARKDSAARHGLSRMLVGALRCISGGFLRADVLQVAKSGFSSLTRDEADSLENYAITHGINRGKWLRPFPYGDDAADMDELRVRLISPVEALRDTLRRAKTAGDSVEAIFRFLEDTNAYDRLMTREEALLSRGMAAEATQNRQVWTILMTLLDQLYALLSTQKANQRDLARFVESGLTGASISSLPPQPDTVMIGEAGHLMTGRIDALLVMGMQDGALGSTADSLLSETERRTLCDLAQRAIGLTQQETCALRQSDFYRTLSLPRRFLTVTCSQGGQDGTAFRPAGLLEDMTQLFPHMVVSGGVLANDVAPLSPAMALDALPHHLRQAVDTDTPLSEQWANVLRWLYFDPEWHSRCQAVLDALNRHGTAIFLSRDHTRRLFTQDKVSISRLEGFAQCPYRHFVNYGLKPVIRREYEFDPADVGDFYHAAMEGYAALALKEPDFPDLPDEKIHALMDTVLLPLTTAWADGPLNETPSLRLQGEKYRRTVHRAAWMFTHHAQHSRFRTVGEEVVFGEEDGLPPVVLTLHDGRKIALRGKIDRIDRWEGDEGVYLLVSDYKSSHRDIDPTRLWYGLQLQLLLYLQAACEGLDGNPAGAFYFTIQDPMVDTADVKESAEKAIAKKLHLKGIVLADVNVVEALDSNPGYSFTKIFNADSSVASSSDGYTSEEMAALLAHAKKMAAELADRILTAWRGYTDPDAFIFAETGGEPHNTITPIARRRGEQYELDLVLRNNITTPEYPLGVFHPHQELHHIKKENIGLIEVMGLAVLPSRLKQEMADLAEALVTGRDIRQDEQLAKHADWAEELKTRHTFTQQNAAELLRQEIGAVFATVLEHAGVYKCTPEGRTAFCKFIRSVL